MIGVGLMVDHHQPKCLVKFWIAVFKVKVTDKVNNFSFCLSLYCLTAEPSVTKLGVVISHHHLLCHGNKLGC